MSRGAMKIGILFVLIVFASLYLVSLLGDGITGFAVLETGAIISSNTTLDLGDSVTSMRVTGSISGSGNVVLYLDGKVVVDSALLNTSLENYCQDTCSNVIGSTLTAVVDGDVLLIVTDFNYTSDTIVTIPEEAQTNETNQTFNQTDGDAEQTTEPVTLSEDVGIEAVFNTSNSTQFDSGKYNRTLFNTSGFVQLNQSDLLQELPNNQLNETNYTFGGIDMVGNVLLLHFNNESGKENTTQTGVYDWSGNNKNGTWSGRGQSNGTAKLGTFAGGFDGINDYINITSNINATTDLTITAWIYPRGFKGTGSANRIVTNYMNNEANHSATGVLDTYDGTDGDGLRFCRFDSTSTLTCTPASGTLLNKNKWYFVTGRYNGTHLTTYINGREISTAAYPETRLHNQYLTKWAIGEDSDVSAEEFFNGSIDEVAIWNRSLSADEIKLIYDRQNGAFTSIGQYDSQIFDAGETQNWTNITWRTEVPYGLNLVNFQANETGNFERGFNMSNAQPSNKLLFHFDNVSGFENTTQTGLYDWSGNNHNGTWFGRGQANGTAKFGSSAGWFDGNDDYINITGNINVSTQLTIAAWIYPVGFRGGCIAHRIVSNYVEVGNSTGTGVFDTGTGGGDICSNGLRFCMTGLDQVTVCTSSSGSVLQKNTWYFVAATFNNADMRTYLNNVQLTNAALDFPETFMRPRHDIVWAIGEDPKIGGAIEYFNGSIDEVAIWNRTLSAAELKDLYRRGVARLNLTARSCNDANCDTETFADVTNDTSKQSYIPVASNRYFQYRYTFTTDDGDFTPQLYNVTIDTRDTQAATLSGLFPPNGALLNLSAIEIGATIVDTNGINHARANLTYPNGSFAELNLTTTGVNRYNVTYTLPAAGSYRVQFIINDSNNNLDTSQITLFTVDR
ncbi:MAG TPA: LamG domain-containing protein, partial [Candidatus Nanoarchaeia archaeon]|nr:LamG domain-containing protein [Candidatus Nanoarchaeia archaeon]